MKPLIVILALATSLIAAPFVGRAFALIGRPLTPLSFAGVARRTTRRAVVYGGAAASPYYGGASPYYGGASPYYGGASPYYW